jgi:flagellar motility protein MotE (MotC chaperone)
MPRCTAVKPNGERCTLPATGQHGLCWAHDPANRERRRRTASRGGRSKANREVAAIKADISDVIAAVRSQALDRAVGVALFQGFNTLLRALEQERRLRETEELEERLASLEERLGLVSGGATTSRGSRP